MQRPDSNLPGPSQLWRRAIEDEQDLQNQQIQNVLDEIDRLSNSDGGVAQLFAQLKTGDIKTLYDQLKALYATTGTTYPPVPVAPTPPPVVPKYTTIQTTATWSRTWGSSTFYTGGGKYTDATMLYQGSSPENKIGMWGISMGSAAGKYITDMQIFLQNVEYSWASGGTAAFGTHSNASPPSGKPGRINGWDVGWAEGQGKWASVPPNLWGSFSNGAFKGFTVGGIGPNNPNSAIFMGVGQGAPPQLKITYQI